MFDNLTNFLINRKITQGANESLTNRQFMQNELEQFLASPERAMMMIGERYYDGKHDILKKRRTMIDPNGKKERELFNLPNNKIVDNQYRKMVNQKKNYLMGKPITISTENKAYSKLLDEIFTKRIMRLIKNMYKDALNGGKGWLFFGYDAEGELKIRKFKPYEILPFWSDSEHSVLDAALRVYDVSVYDGKDEKKIQRVEIYTQDGIDYFERAEQGQLIAVEPYHQSYFTVSVDDKEQGFNWSKIPLIAFKYNDTEMPLIRAVKSLQDGINQIESTFQDNMQEDPRNTLLVLINYDGQNLEEFKSNIAQYGVIKIRGGEGGGDVKSLQIEVNAENYKSILKVLKDALIENAMGYDAKDDRLNGNPNEMNIQSMYSDIDLDANETESEFQAGFEELMWFINCHLFNTGKGDFSKEEVTFTFNRSTMVNKGEIINEIKNSTGIISKRTQLENHPFVNDVDEELKRIEEEKKAEIDMYGFGNMLNPNNDDDDDDIDDKGNKKKKEDAEDE